MTLEEYHITYYVLLGIFFVTGGLFQQFKNDKNGNIGFAFIIAFILSIFIGVRDINIGADTHQYYELFNKFSHTSLTDLGEYFKFGGEPFFKLAYKFISIFFTYEGAKIISSFTFTILTYIFARYVIKLHGNGSITVFFLCLLASSVSWNEQVNIIRSGIGIGFLLLFITSFYENPIKLRTILLALCAVCTHFSTAMFITLVIISKFINFKNRWYLGIFLCAIILSYLGYSVLSLGIFGDLDFDKAQRYIQNIEGTSYKVGFRPTFALYNSFFFIIALILKKYFSGIIDLIFKFYFLASILFFFWFTIPYSDRIGAFSWTVIPCIFYPPLASKFKKNKFIPISTVIIYGIISFFIMA